MPKLIVNDKEIEIEEGLTVLQACEQAGVEIPRFCYHEKLSIAGNCRMCLVEMEKSAKPIASCAITATEGMNIKTNTLKVEKARKNVMELLLANHPLDCPVCDQGGECDLQDQSMFYGLDLSRFTENKRSVKKKYMGPLIKTEMTRCIHCTRCIRFAREVAGINEIGAIGRGEDMQITTYLEKAMESELSANVIDLCPVGALTSKPYAFEARPWELKNTETIDVMDAVGSNIRVDTYGWEVKRILPKINEDINEEWISDKTRYACDGLLKQRLDKPYIRENGKLIKSNWTDAVQIVINKIKNTKPSQIAGFVGDLVDLESMYIFKKFFNKSLSSTNLEFRNEKRYLNPNERINYLFNSTINGIEEADLILLIGTNPRQEATILNARIRKSYVKNKIKIYSIGDPGELTYPYEIIGHDTSVIKDIIEGSHHVSLKIKNSEKPLIIIGESILNSDAAEYIFKSIKNFLTKNDKINPNWNSFNILTQRASNVGAMDLGLYKITKKDNYEVLNKLNNNEFKLIYLLGADELKFNKKDEFIIYQGSHGDKGASIADVILPSAAYTEKDGYYVNLEGRIQKAFKASYPPGESKEDWEIINNISQFLNKRLDIINKFDLETKLIKSNNLYSKESYITKEKNSSEINQSKIPFINSKLEIKQIDYYFTNPICRASKTMLECKTIKNNFKLTGTEG